MTTTLPLRERILGGELLVGTFCNLGAPVAVEVAGRSGLDWLVIDLEHGSGTEADLLIQIYAALAAGITACVRVEVNARLRLGRALDLGAAGIMVPRLDSADEARTAVAHLRYPPDGIRGVALSTRGASLAALAHRDVRAKNQTLPLLVQVESPSAVAEAPEIAAIDGVDVLFVGPTDLTHSLGVPGEFTHPTYLEALDLVVAGARSAGKEAGILLRRPEDLERHVDLGFRFIGVGSDSAWIADGAATVVATTTAIRQRLSA